MGEKIIKQNEYATLWFDDAHGIVHHAFHKFVFGDAFREILDGGAELMKRPGVAKWLSDDRGNSALPKGDSDWAQTDWFPRVIAAGWKHWALVQPAKVVGQINMKRFTSDYAAQGLNVAVFSELEPARAWLEAQ